jgi:Flp pilus assembly protein TadD
VVTARSMKTLIRSLLAVMPLAIFMTGCQTADITASPVASEEPFIASNDPAYLGRKLFERADYALAERNFRTAVERNPGDTASWVGLAASYDQLARFDLADRAYEQATRLSGATFEILNNRGYSYMLRGDSRTAASMLQRARALRPGDPVVANNLVLLTQSRT